MLFAVDLAVGDDVVVIAAFGAAPVVAAFRCDARRTAVVGALAVALAVVAASVAGDLEMGQTWVRIGTVAALTGLAVWVAELHERTGSAARRLEESFARLDAIYARAPIGLSYHDLDMRFVRVNDRLVEMVGVPAERLLGSDPAEVLPDLGEAIAAALGRALSTGRPQMDVQVTGESPAWPGETREYLISAWPVRAGAQTFGIGAILTDVTERRTAERAVDEQTVRYETLQRALGDVGEGMAMLAGERVLYVNEALAGMLGYRPEEITALPSIFEVLPEDVRQEARRRARRRERGQSHGELYELRIRHRDGHPVDLELAGVPLELDGRSQLVVVARDITARKRAEAERERLLARSHLLAEASTLFDASLDEQATLERVAWLIVRELADTCIIVRADRGERLRRAAVAASNRELEATLEQMARDYPLEQDEGNPLVRVARDGRPRLLRGEDLAAALRAGSADERHHELLRRLGQQALVVVPLRARGRALGSLACGMVSEPDADDRELLALFGDLARRASLAIDNARLYAERTAVARTLQRSLLPPDLPTLPGLELAARYRAAGEGNEIGGDFYDCFALGADEWALVVGDVCGKGAEAAAVTALARYTLRASALHTRSPSDVLAELNEVIRRQRLDFRFATVLYAALARRGDALVARLASGGHPLPLVLRAGGTVEYVGRPGTLLGVLPEPSIPEADVTLAEGDAMILYTDGVIEASPADDAFGPDRFAEFVRGCAGKDAADIAQAIETAVLEVQRGSLRDDVAVVVVRVASEAGAPFVDIREGVAAAA